MAINSESGVIVLCSEHGLVGDFVDDLELYELIEFFRFLTVPAKMKNEETFFGEEGGVVVTCCCCF